MANCQLRFLGLRSYEEVWQEMISFTQSRSSQTIDELWVVEHPAVYTLGRNGRPEHILNPADIPVVKSDRGGQVTYHGPGQLIIYLLIDIRRKGLGVRALVTAIENAIIQFLSKHKVTAYAKPEAPGVYISEAKIAALGLRIRNGCSYHGLSLNVSMDSTPFYGINPCGYEGLKVTTLEEQGITLPFDVVAKELLNELAMALHLETIMGEYTGRG